MVSRRITEATDKLNAGDRRLLRILRRNHAPLSEREMAAFLGIHRNGVRWRLAKLEAAGMIDRRKPRGRVVTRGVFVTPRGRRA